MQPSASQKKRHRTARQPAECKGRALPAVFYSPAVASLKGLSIRRNAPNGPLVGLSGPHGRRSDLQTASLVSFGRHALQHVAIALAQRVAGQFVEYHETIGDLIGRKPFRDVAQDLVKDRVLCSLRELYEAEHALTEHDIRYANHCSFLDRGMASNQLLLYLY